jgi:hypothetical protein
MSVESCALWALGQFEGVDLGDARLKKESCIWRR